MGPTVSNKGHRISSGSDMIWNDPDPTVSEKKPDPDLNFYRAGCGSDPSGGKNPDPDSKKIFLQNPDPGVLRPDPGPNIHILLYKIQLSIGIMVLCQNKHYNNNNRKRENTEKIEMQQR